MDRWSLELRGRDIQVEHIPGYKNKVADCLSCLPFVTRKRNDNPLKNEDISVNAIQTEDDTCCPLCEVDLTDTKSLQQEDKHCIRISKLIVDPKSRFHERDSYGYDDKGNYITLIEKMVESTRQQWYQRSLSKLYSRKCMTTLAILALAKITH